MADMPSVLICGIWHHAQYEKACADALESIGATVHRFDWGPYFTSNVLGKAELKYVVGGPSVHAMNGALIRKVQEVNPDIVLVWRGTHVLPATLKRLREVSRAVLVSYVNDDPFAPSYTEHSALHVRRLWRLFLETIPHYDVHFVYRPVNLADAAAFGAREAHILMPYFMSGIHYPRASGEVAAAELACDVIFVGHHEPDGRVEQLLALQDAGLTVRVYGGNWPEDIQRALGQKVRPLLEKDYRAGLIASRMALCFLSRLNRDVYTRRCFEIPACETVLVSERTEALTALFDDGREAIFFSSTDELVTRALWIRDNPRQAAEIARSGRERVWRDGHDVVSRMRQFLADLEPALEAKRAALPVR